MVYVYTLKSSIISAWHALVSQLAFPLKFNILFLCIQKPSLFRPSWAKGAILSIFWACCIEYIILKDIYFSNYIIVCMLAWCVCHGLCRGQRTTSWRSEENFVESVLHLYVGYKDRTQVTRLV